MLKAEPVPRLARETNMQLYASDAFALCSILLSFLVFKAYIDRRQRLAMTPPSPLPLPLLGNIFDIDLTEPWKTYNMWSKKYNS
jgi:hypothetical protein